MEHDIGAMGYLFGIFYREFRASVAAPTYCLCPVAIAFGYYFNLFRHHEGRVEAQTEVSYDGFSLVFVLVQEVCNTRKGYLVDVFVYLFCRHTYAIIAYGECSGFFVETYTNLQIVGFAFKLACCSKRAQLLCCIDSVRYQLAKEDVVVGIEEFLNDREYVLCRYTYFTFLHNLYFYLLISICLYHYKWRAKM